MKKYFAALLVVAGLITSACQQNNSNKGLSTDLVKDGKKAAIKFTEDSYDFGTITEGEVVSHTFEFTNTGEGDLIITEAVTSCGCTVPEWPREPIAPGQKGKIEVKFNSAGKHGLEKKTVTIVANTTPPYTPINISSTVVAPIPRD